MASMLPPFASAPWYADNKLSTPASSPAGSGPKGIGTICARVCGVELETATTASTTTPAKKAPATERNKRLSCFIYLQCCYLFSCDHLPGRPAPSAPPGAGVPSAASPRTFGKSVTNELLRTGSIFQRNTKRSSSTPATTKYAERSGNPSARARFFRQLI